ncbi:MAG: hypothetical protein V3U29_08470 [Phycisphaeraceae bacterium]
MTILATTLIDEILGLTRISWSDPRTSLGWRVSLPAWAWALIVLTAIAFAGWSYYRLLGSRAARVTLAMVRVLLIVFIAALLAGPMLVLAQERVEPDWLLVLVDRSASMQIADTDPRELGMDSAVFDKAAGVAISRDAALRAGLAYHGDVFGPDQLGKQRQVIWLGFDGTSYPLGAADDPTSSVPFLPDPSGQATALRTAIEQALQRAIGRPVSGIVLFTDGRSPESTGADLIRRLQQQAVAVFPVPMGSASARLDLAVTDVHYPEKAFVNDTVPVTVWVQQVGQGVGFDPSRVTVSLIDVQAGSLLDEQTLTPDASLDEPIRLTAQSQTIGQVQWRIEVTYDTDPSAARDVPAGLRELITENNTARIRLELIDRPIRVLYVDGYPRWEYRYLKNMLMREKSILSSILLLSADRGFAQEGDVPITRLPGDAEEIEPFDVIIVGDVPSSFFSAAQLSLIRDHVGARGAGLLWVGGAYDAPISYETTPLADLLPMRRPGAVGAVDPASGPFAMRPTRLAETLNVLRLRSASADAADDRSAAAWPVDLPPLSWVQDLGPLKPTAEVLGQWRRDGSAAPGIPLVTRMRYGAGQTIYVATDDTWRWRYGRGEFYFEQFWVQLVRMLGRNRLQQAGDRIRLRVPRSARVHESVVVELVMEDTRVLDLDLRTVAVDVFAGGDEQAGPVERIELWTKQGGSEADASADPLAVSRGRSYKAQWRPGTPGSLVLRVVEPGLSELNITRAVEVLRRDDELRQPMPDHARLEALANQTGGQVVRLNELDRLVSLVPNRARRTPNDIREPLWDSSLALVIVVVLLTAEWVCRKVIRLV